jgi:hypothetical protein
MLRLCAAAAFLFAISPIFSFALAGFLLINLREDTPPPVRWMLAMLVLLSLSLMVGMRSLDPADSNDIDVYFDIYQNIASGDLDMLTAFGSGFEVALPLLLFTWATILPPLSLNGLMFCLALTSSLMFMVWIELTFYAGKNLKLPALLGISILMLNVYYSTQLTRQFLSLIMLLYAFSATGFWRRIFYIAVASTFHLTALPFFAIYLLARRGWTGWLGIILAALLLRQYFVQLLSAFDVLPEAVAEKLVYYVDNTAEFTAADLVSMRMMLLLGVVSLVVFIASRFKLDAPTRPWLAVPWITGVIQFLLIPIPLASLRATLLIHSIVPGLVAYKMLSGRAHRIRIPALNILLFYKIMAFALAENGANLRPTYAMITKLLQ